MKNRGFIHIVILVIAGLILLKYVYDIDVLGKTYEFLIFVWGKYGVWIVKVWEYIKTKL